MHSFLPNPYWVFKNYKLYLKNGQFSVVCYLLGKYNLATSGSISFRFRSSRYMPSPSGLCLTVFVFFINWNRPLLSWDSPKNNTTSWTDRQLNKIWTKLKKIILFVAYKEWETVNSFIFSRTWDNFPHDPLHLQYYKKDMAVLQNFCIKVGFKNIQPWNLPKFLDKKITW